MTEDATRNALTNRLLNPEAMTRIDAPWRYDGNGVILDAHGISVCFMHNLHEAQIPLILAAPELLAAAKDFVDIIEDHGCVVEFARSPPNNFHWLNGLKAAIAKAEDIPP